MCVGVDLDDVLEELPLPEDFKNGILERTGRVGYTLDLIEAYEKNRPIKSEDDLKILAETYGEAVKWVEGFRAAF